MANGLYWVNEEHNCGRCGTESKLVTRTSLGVRVHIPETKENILLPHRYACSNCGKVESIRSN